MSSLANCDELCDGPPTFTAEEKRRIQEYQPPDVTTPRLPWYRRRKGQSGAVLPIKVQQRERADVALQRAREGRAVVLCATTQLVGEGFDLPAADTFVIATPIKFNGRLIQAMGRVLRPAAGKTHGQIIDLCDWQVPVLAAGARARAKIYRTIKREESGS